MKCDLRALACVGQRLSEQSKAVSFCLEIHFTKCTTHFHFFHELIQVSDFMFRIAIATWHTEFDHVFSDFVSDCHLVSPFVLLLGVSI
jgi:hypothetical protein